uniref:oligopeptidase A n=1 Tax=Erpetoichthys calabaricus TaxID=27687 RepID=A0A8C4T4J2_ERPCA
MKGYWWLLRLPVRCGSGSQRYLRSGFSLRKLGFLICTQVLILLFLWKWGSSSLFSRVASAESDFKESLNPLLDTSGLPHFSAISVDHIVPGIIRAVAEQEKGLQQLEHKLQSSNFPTSWASIVEFLEVLLRPLEYSWSVVTHLENVKDSPQLRHAIEKTQPLILELSSRLQQSLPIYNVFKELSLSNDLDASQQRIIEFTLRNMKQNGVELKGEKRHRFNYINQCLTNLSRAFRNNILDSASEFSILLKEKKSVEELPETTLRFMANAAAMDTKKRPDIENGPWKVTLDQTTYENILMYSSKRSLREMLYKAKIGLAASAKYNNELILNEILKLRQEKAQILDYNNYAELSLSTKMAKTVDKVWNLIDFLHNKTYAVAIKELESLTEFAHTHGHRGKLENWDIVYWKQKQMKSLFSIPSEELPLYFPVERVLAGLFKLCLDLFGVTVKPADSVIEVWDPLVKVFYVYNEEEIHIASLFLDLYSRPKEKQSGAWMDGLQSKSALLKEKPVAIIVCNQIPPIGSAPSLMSFDDVETLFHEFGHALQHMLSVVPYAGASGINSIEWDAVEFASQFMSNWIYDRYTISAISGHYQTGEPLPSHMLESLLKAHHFMMAFDLQYQLYLTAIDIALHNSSEPLEVIKKQISDKYNVVKPIKDDRFPCTFLHVFGSEAYAAGYYSYMWAQVLAEDAFTAFEEVGLENRKELSKIGHRFKDTVLGLGSSKSALDVFRMFRGRDPSPAALLKTYGLIQSTEKEK